MIAMLFIEIASTGHPMTASIYVSVFGYTYICSPTHIWVDNNSYNQICILLGSFWDDKSKE